MPERAVGTYVYCVVSAKTAPKARRARGLPGMGPTRLLEVDRDLFAAVADAPLKQYGADAINSRLSDLDWVSRAAVAHEAVVESFIDAPAVLPMKLFTIFTSDDRARDHVRAERARIDRFVKRVANHHEWGVRIVLTGSGGGGSGGSGRSGGSRGSRRIEAATDLESGVGFLSRKKAQRDTAKELAERAREVVADVYDRLAARAHLARRRVASELPAQGGPLLLDAAFLVPRTRSASFRSLAAREARSLQRDGYGLTLTGPWPPYTFVQD